MPVDTVGALLVDEDVPLLVDILDRIESVPLGSEADLGQVAGRLFAAMRTLDAAGCDAIYIRALGTSGLRPGDPGPPDARGPRRRRRLAALTRPRIIALRTATFHFQ